MIPFLSTGLILGFSAGIAPGPLLALVIAETLKHKLSAGVKVAFAPVLSDLPIVVLSFTVMSGLATLQNWLAVISVAGGLFVAHLGWENLRTAGIPVGIASGARERSLRKAVAVNLLSPHPYLFWLTVGAPMTVRAMEHSAAAALAFIGGFYVLLTGAKIAVALIVARSSILLTGKAYVWIMRGLGIVLFVLAGFLIREGIRMLL